MVINGWTDRRTLRKSSERCSVFVEQCTSSRDVGCCEEIGVWVYYWPYRAPPGYFMFPTLKRKFSEMIAAATWYFSDQTWDFFFSCFGKVKEMMCQVCWTSDCFDFLWQLMDELKEKLRKFSERYSTSSQDSQDVVCNKNVITEEEMQKWNVITEGDRKINCTYCERQKTHREQQAHNEKE